MTAAGAMGSVPVRLDQESPTHTGTVRCAAAPAQTAIPAKAADLKALKAAAAAPAVNLPSVRLICGRGSGPTTPTSEQRWKGVWCCLFCN